MNYIKKILWMIKFTKKTKAISNINKEHAIKALNEFLPGRLVAPAFTHSLDLTGACVDLMIVVPVYNVGRYLRKCIESILNQETQFTYKVVFVNDGSTDDSMQILKEYEDNPSVEIICTENRGVSEARNIALSKNYGKYILFIDSDDYLAEAAIEKLMFVAMNQNADIVEGGYTRFNDAGCDFVGHNSSVQCVMANELFGFAWGKVIKNSCMKNMCFPQGYGYEDTIMSFLIHNNAKKIYTIPDNIVFYRNNPIGLDKMTSEKKNVVDTFWLTKYCLEEFVKCNYKWSNDVEILCLKQFYINWVRLRHNDLTIQESVFVLTCDLYDRYFRKENRRKKPIKYRMLERSLFSKSYEAYQYVMLHWDMLE